MYYKINNYNIVWHLSENDVFNFLKNDLENVFHKDMIPKLEENEIAELFHQFKLFPRNFYKDFSRSNGYEEQNSDDIFLYNKYELKH